MSDAKRTIKFREDHGLTQDEAARVLGVSVYTISSIESGRRNLSPPQDSYVTAIQSGEIETSDTPYISLGKAVKALESGDKATAVRMCHCALIMLSR